MPEHIRALIVILGLAVPTLWWLGRQLTPTIGLRSYQKRAGLWLLLTVLLFVSQSFWLFVLLAAVLLLRSGYSDTNPAATFAFLLFLAPPFRSAIEGFAGINRFIDLDYLRLLSLTVLLPCALSTMRNPTRHRLFAIPADKYLLAYLLLQLLIVAQETTTTDTMRIAVSLMVDTWLPYYVFSRTLTTSERLKETTGSFVSACALLAVIALFESAKGWLLYSSLPQVLGLKWSYGSYMLRESSLRSTASAGHSIYLGYLLAVSFGLHLGLRRDFSSGTAWRAVAVILLAGLAVTLARGPWVGAAAIFVTAALTAPSTKRTLAKYALIALPVALVLMATPLGSRVVSLLPFVGRFDEGSVDYRQQLFIVSWDVFMMHPVFGSPHYLATSAMESLRQGEGIIDMVNSYLAIALSTGIVGLGLFAALFVSSAGSVLRGVLSTRDWGGQRFVEGRSLVVATVGALVTIATVGSELAVPVVYWSLAGACAAFGQGRESESATMNDIPVRVTIEEA